MTQKFGAVLMVCAAIGIGFATRTLNGQAQATQAHSGGVSAGRASGACEELPGMP